MKPGATLIPSPTTLPESALPPAVLASLAQQARAGGMGLCMLSPDGEVVYHDPAAGVFFERYATPLLKNPEMSGPELRAAIGRIDVRAAVQAIETAPGVVVCLAPLVDRRQVVAILALSSRAEQFELGEEVLRACGKLALDATWLGQQAADLPGLPTGRLSMAMDLLLAMSRDKLRVVALEQELNSLSTQLANAYEELSLIDQVSGGMRVNRRSAEFFRQVCLDVMPVISVRGMGVALAGERVREEPVLYGQLSLPPGQVQKLSEQLITTLRGRKSVMLINNLAADKQYAWLAEWAHQLIAVPLQRQEKVLGCLFGLDKTHDEFDSVDCKLLTAIASESAIYLENAMLFGDVHDLMMGLLHSLTSAVDAKDAYTCGHSERVALLSRHLAQEIKLSDQEVEHIYMAGLLHDVGKIGVPESVLQKAGRLTPEEFEQMKKHPRVGARILSDVKQMGEIVPGVLHHHERYDGHGYPAGLAGHNIPLMGRIICLADALDAMTSNRTYRRALPLEVALTEVRRCSGTQFDPALAEAFLRVSPEQFRAVLHDHQQKAKKLLELQQALRTA